MPRHRSDDTGLPERVYLEHGMHYYRPKGEKRIKLARERGAAMKEYGRVLQARGAVSARPGAKIGAWMDRYMIEHFPKLADATQHTRRAQLENLRPVFGDALPDDVTTVDVYAYKDARKGAPGQANGEIASLSHLYTKMIEWGGATKNPCFRLVKFQKNRRKRVPSIAELSAFVALAKNPLVPLYVQIKLAWGLRKKDILDLPRIPATATEHVLEVSKSMRWNEMTGEREGELRRLVITPAMQALLRQVYALPGRPHICQFLFSPSRGANRGKRYTDKGFDSLMETVHRAFREAGGKPFHEHDIRASTATLDPAGAKARLGHKDQSTTDIYLRTFDIEDVQPLEATLTTTKKKEGA